MPKSQKKNATLDCKPQITQKHSKETKKSAASVIKLNKAQSKVTKKPTEAVQLLSRDSKQYRILALLQRPGGATIEEMARATSWQKHSVQGMMSGVLKKKLGLTITSDKEERGRFYRITGSVSRL